MIYSKIFRAARANLLRVVKNFWRKTHEKSKIYLKIFPRCARQFVKNFIKVIHDFLKKIYFYEIEGRWVAHYQKLRGRCWWKSSFYYGKIGRTLPNFEYHKWAMGAMLMKIVILLKENESHITKKWGGAMLVKIVILLWQNWSHITKFRISQMGNIQKCSALRAIIC